MCRVAAPQVPWRRIAGLRDILVHDYFSLDEVILWDVVVNEVPTLMPQFLQLRTGISDQVD